MLLSMAGQVGQHLANSFWAGVAQAQAQAEINRMRREYEMHQAAQRAAVEREAARRRDIERNRELLASLAGRIGTTELGMSRIETQELEMVTTNQMFGVPANPTGTMRYEAPAPNSFQVSSPPDVEGRAVHPGTEAEVTAMWGAYLEALTRRNEAQARLESAQQSLQLRDLAREAAERRLLEVQSSATSPDDAGVREANEFLDLSIDLAGEAAAEVSAAQGAVDLAQAAVTASTPAANPAGPGE
jgi:hypothetical protein